VCSSPPPLPPPFPVFTPGVYGASRTIYRSRAYGWWEPTKEDREWFELFLLDILSFDDLLTMGAPPLTWPSPPAWHDGRDPGTQVCRDAQKPAQRVEESR
jgi:hypothetical protein